MHYIILVLKDALSLLLHPSRELIGVVVLSMLVSGGGLIAAAIAGLPLAAFLAFSTRFAHLRTVTVHLLNTFMGMPPVVAGLALYLLLSRSGPFGVLGLLYTPSIMALAQFLLALPLVAALSHSAMVAVRPEVILAARSLGASPFQRVRTVIYEARYGIIAGLMAGFGRVMAEVGAVIIVGGNIKGYTRTMTTAIALETDKGDFELAIALGILLLAISLVMNFSMYFFQRKGKYQ